MICWWAWIVTAVGAAREWPRGVLMWPGPPKERPLVKDGSTNKALRKGSIVGSNTPLGRWPREFLWLMIPSQR